ncbi:MAG: site-specific DNA-methyltransferase (adenine-specific) [Candidatus Electronema aureum]|uniref:Methyltransferase n=1 Tax=Candidatus Electronema aureum TaxID=2005002 RepID=A0A521FZD3_9BACT|nr:MAG: site-specific DNA-methyltransferase (adenine-specific) [Candidatus Electronema aureum]
MPSCLNPIETSDSTINNLDEKRWSVYNGDAVQVLKTLPDNSYNCIVTSPPYYWLRDYGTDEQIGKEDTVEQYIFSVCAVFDEIYRVMKDDGLVFINLGDTYYSGKGQSHGVDKKSRKRRFGLRAVDKSGGLDIGIKPKSLIGIPWRVALEMMKRNWTLRSSIIWYRKYSLPESVKDRPKRSYEHIFMFVKNRKYYFNQSAFGADEQGDVWTIVPRPKSAHLGTAPYPDELVQRCLDMGCPPGGSVLDPFAGSGTTLRVAVQSGRFATGIDNNPEFCQFMSSELQRISK